VRELAGAELNETNIIASALNIEGGPGAHGAAAASGAAHA
jgi:hypothetical protein